VNGNEDVVMRILASSKPLALEEMGMNSRNLSAFEAIIHKPYGLILCVGPTGSGKTTTLHSALRAINHVDIKIWTAEDPVEITQAGLRQVQVYPKIGLTFANALRAFLRADPDVIMIGEMRDEETATIAVQSSLTGHLVFSTLHTNSAPETITRLLDMGLDPFSFADSLLGILAQRLCRRICEACRRPDHANDEEFRQIIALYGSEKLERNFNIGAPSDLLLWRAVGCKKCKGSGYQGRVALHELLITNEEIKSAIERRIPVVEIRQLAIASGMTTLVQDGIEKILGGITDMKQVLAVCMR
jgi:type II secretory ATPase GspE/PulE/Tfp pilus assembly ATPase PilB-like protein